MHAGHNWEFNICLRNFFFLRKDVPTVNIQTLSVPFWVVIGSEAWQLNPWQTATTVPFPAPRALHQPFPLKIPSLCSFERHMKSSLCTLVPAFFLHHVSDIHPCGLRVTVSVFPLWSGVCPFSIRLIICSSGDGQLFWAVWIKLLRTSVYNFLCGCRYSCP
jgi:hypothetical protein